MFNDESPGEPDIPQYLENNETDQCVYYNSSRNKIFTSTYEGIPENLLINVVVWMLLLIGFAVLRKSAWNYGRLALVQKDEERWTQVFYRTTDVLDDSEVDSITTLDTSINTDKGICSWFFQVFKITDADILQKCGSDAIQYLSFQRHIIVYMTIVMIISLAVVLPINFQGNLEGDEKTFGHTTFVNLNPESKMLWIHATLAILYLPLGWIIMRHFTRNVKYVDEDTYVSRTLMISSIPKRFCLLNDIQTHFREAYPEIEVQDIQLAYDIARVSELHQEREKVRQAKLYCENYLKNRNKRIYIRPYSCGRWSTCCDVFGCPVIEAIDYYKEEEMRLIHELAKEREEAYTKPLGIAFVTLVSVEAAKKVFSDHLPSCKCSNNPPSSSVSRQLDTHEWIVSFAPTPDDILWENLAVSLKSWYVKAVLVNVALFIVLFFMTTPVIIVNLLDTMNFKDEIGKMSPILSEFVPSVLLCSIAALLPFFVSYSDQWISHWTRSEQNYAIMRKTFFFLIFMVLILPSLGLTSAQTFVEWAIHAQSEQYRWKCLFLPDKGAFFVNYIITSAFIGCSLELIRLPELFLYTLRICSARSRAETSSIRKAVYYEFPFGVNYARFLVVFAMTVVYSLSCPLITPFGLLFMVFKHFVDRYNIYFVYAPSKISQQIHKTALNIVILSISLLQLTFLMFMYIRIGVRDITVYSIIGFFFTIVILWAQNFVNCCKDFNPIYKGAEVTSSNIFSPRRGMYKSTFMPEVLQNAPHSSGTDSLDSPLDVQRTYGTAVDSPIINIPDRTILYQSYDASHSEL